MQKLYLPFMNGKYEIAPGLKMLKFDKKHPCFDIDDHYDHYRKHKLAAVQAKPSVAYTPPDADLNPEEKQGVCDYIMQHLSSEHPEDFSWDRAQKKFTAHLSQESIAYADAAQGAELFGFLAMQMQEDLAIWKLDEAKKKEWLAALHVVFPSGWEPEDKIGKSFASVHEPVPGFAPMAEKAWQFATTILT